MEDERDKFCEDLGVHLAEALEQLGVEDADMSDGRMLADVVYCLGYRKPIGILGNSDMYQFDISFGEYIEDLDGRVYQWVFDMGDWCNALIEIDTSGNGEEVPSEETNRG